MGKRLISKNTKNTNKFKLVNVCNNVMFTNHNTDKKTLVEKLGLSQVKSWQIIAVKKVIKQKIIVKLSRTNNTEKLNKTSSLKNQPKTDKNRNFDIITKSKQPAKTECVSRDQIFFAEIVSSGNTAVNRFVNSKISNKDHILVNKKEKESEILLLGLNRPTITEFYR